MNIVIFTGRLAVDPELKMTAQGTPVCTFSLAVDRPGKKDETDFHTIVAWRKTAEFVSRYMHKGSKIVFKGEARTRTFQDRNGNNRKVTEFFADSVEFADSKPQSNGQQAYSDFEEIEDDGLPFN